MGALGSCRGGGWDIKDARCRKMGDARCRKHDNLVKGEARWFRVYGGRPTDPLSMSYDPALAQQPGILFSILAREAVPIR